MTPELTPELLTAIFTGVIGVIAALTTLVVQLVGLRKKVNRIETATDGAATAARETRAAMDVTVTDLRRQLAAEVAEGVSAALLARVAAADVQAALSAPPPTEPQEDEP